MNLIPDQLFISKFKKNLTITNNIMLFIILFATLSITSYVVGEIEFILIALDMFLIVIFTLFEAKKEFIYSVYAIEPEHLNKNKYSVNIKDKITDLIDYKKLFVNIKLNKIIYVDKENNVYISDVVLYNVKDKQDNVDIYINSTNMNDYIVVEEGYY
jgi:hypothetical protein